MLSVASGSVSIIVVVLVVIVLNAMASFFGHLQFWYQSQTEAVFLVMCDPSMNEL